MIRLGHTSISPDVNIWFCQRLKDFKVNYIKNISIIFVQN